MFDAQLLVLEDNAVIAILIESTLSEAGYTNIQVCGSADAAAAFLKTATPDFAFLDFNLGSGKTSGAIARALHALDVPFVLMSGYTDATGIIPSDLGEAGRISKPFRRDHVLEYLEKFGV